MGLLFFQLKCVNFHSKWLHLYPQIMKLHRKCVIYSGNTKFKLQNLRCFLKTLHRQEKILWQSRQISTLSISHWSKERAARCYPCLQLDLHSILSQKLLSFEKCWVCKVAAGCFLRSSSTRWMGRWHLFQSRNFPKQTRARSECISVQGLLCFSGLSIQQYLQRIDTHSQQG